MKKLIAMGLFLLSSSVFATEWAKGEVRRIDIENKKLTIKHEEIKSLDMPPMSMVFYVENGDILKGINPTTRTRTRNLMISITATVNRSTN